MARWSKLLFFRMGAIALSLGLAFLVIRLVLLPGLRRHLATVAVAGEAPGRSLRAERALMRMGEQGMNALFEEAQRRWELLDVRGLQRSRVTFEELNGTPHLPCWVVCDDEGHVEVLTDRLRVVRFGEELMPSPRTRETFEWMGLEPVDFAKGMDRFGRRVLQEAEDIPRIIRVSIPDRYFTAGMWKAFWLAHCAWQKGMPCPEYEKWFSFHTKMANYRPYIWMVRDELADALYYSAVEDMEEKPWEEIRAQLERIVRVFPGVPAAEDAARLREHVESIVREERDLDLSKEMRDMSPEEMKGVVAYYLREKAEWVTPLMAVRRRHMEWIASKEGRPFSEEPLLKEQDFPEIDWELAFPMLVALKRDKRPTRRIFERGFQRTCIYDDEDLSGWCHYVTIGERAAEFESQMLREKGKADSDADGLPDWWERLYFGHLDEDGPDDHDSDGITNLEEWEYDPWDDLSDRDGDGFTNKEEREADSYPEDPHSRPDTKKEQQWGFWVR